MACDGQKSKFTAFGPFFFFFSIEHMVQVGYTSVHYLLLY